MRYTHLSPGGAALLLLALAACSSGGDGGTEPEPRGSIAGTVTAAGAGVGGAQVALSGTATRTATTAADGGFRFNDLAPGGYSMSITLPADFQLAAGEIASKTATVSAGGTATVNWSAQRAGPAAQQDTIRMAGTSFAPEDLRVPVGRTVVWLNTQAIPHTVTPQAHTLWQRVVTNGPGVALTHTFTAAGTFSYVCEFHAGMTGRVIVQ